MPLWSYLSQRFQERSSFTDPYEIEELYFQIRKFVHDGRDYKRIRQIQLDILQELLDDLSSMRLEVENGGMPSPSPQLSKFEPHYISSLVAAFHHFHQNRRSLDSFDPMQTLGKYEWSDFCKCPHLNLSSVAGYLLFKQTDLQILSKRSLYLCLFVKFSLSLFKK